MRSKIHKKRKSSPNGSSDDCSRSDNVDDWLSPNTILKNVSNQTKFFKTMLTISNNGSYVETNLGLMKESWKCQEVRIFLMKTFKN